MGLKRLMSLMTSKDEWVALQACKIALAGELMQGSKIIGNSDGMIVFETQVGEQGQIIQTMTKLKQANPNALPQALPNTLDLVMKAGIAQPIEVDQG